MIRSSNTDQLGFGCVRNQYRTGCICCPVRAVQEFGKHFPERLTGGERHLPLLRFGDGRPFTRALLQQYLRVSAIGIGQDPDRIGGHSLRIGGATAMYHALGDLQAVRRYGRWSSDAFHLYLWEGSEQQKGVGTKMASDKMNLRAPSMREGAKDQKRVRFKSTA